MLGKPQLACLMNLKQNRLTGRPGIGARSMATGGILIGQLPTKIHPNPQPVQTTEMVQLPLLLKAMAWSFVEKSCLLNDYLGRFSG